MSCTLDNITRVGNTIYFTATVEFPFNHDIAKGTTFEVVGRWEFSSGKIAISLGDYRRAEMELFASPPEGFVDGEYGNGSPRDLVSAKDMADLLTLLVPNLLNASLTAR